MTTEMTDQQFLAYVSAHSRTPRALFSYDDVLRFLKLANVPEKDFPPEGWYALHDYDIADWMKAARKTVAGS